MGETAFRSEDKVGLLVAVVLHVLLAVVLVMQTLFAPDPFVPPERVAVSLATEVSLESTAPDPVPESRAAIAPTLSDLPAPEAADEPNPSQPEARTPPPPPPSRAATRTQPRQPAPERDRSRPDRQPEAPARSTAPSGGSRIGDNFLEGQGSSTRTDETRAPARQIGPREVASIQSSLARQIKPHWSAPSGVDVEQLVTLLDFDLNEDGSLKGRPRIRGQSGITDSNRPQASKHAENAIRAVQLAAPFDLPPQYYNAWKAIRGARFDRNLSR